MIKSLSGIFEYLFFSLLLALAVYISASGIYSKTVIDGIVLWFACVLPSLFPYLFITAVMSSLSVTKKISDKLSPLFIKIFNVGGDCGYAFLLSVISGYPIGAKTVSELKLSGGIGEAESERAACLCSTSSPTFLIGSVGSAMFLNRKFGILLFLSHLSAAIINGVIFSFYKKSAKPLMRKSLKTFKKSTNILYDGAYSAVISVLVVGGLITVFYLLTEILFNLGILSPLINSLTLISGNESLSKGVVFGLFECTKGLKELATLPIKTALPLCAALSGFGGLSVIMQSVAYLKKAKIKTAPFLLSKITAAALSFLTGSIFSFLL